MGDKFNNFVSRYSVLRPPTDVAQISISDEKCEIEEFVAWLQKHKEVTRKQLMLYVS